MITSYNGMRVYVKSYGCWLNKGEAEIIKEILVEKGFTLVDSIESADVAVIHTCAVRGDTETNMLRIIKEAEEKLSKRGGRLVVTGCLVNVRPWSIKKLAPTASLLEPDALEEIARAVDSEVIVVRRYSGKRTRLPLHSGGHTYILPVGSGCLGNCGFCVGKVARRKLVSYPPDLIVKHFKDAVMKGAKQIFLVGQDLAAYGADIGYSLPDLLRTLLDEVDGDYRIRIGMMEPFLTRRFVKELAELMRDERVYNYVHLPLQSGDDRILKLMNRRYTVAEYRAILELMRGRLERLNIVSDMIVGYPGEGEEEFKRSVEAVKKFRFDKTHVARYTLRPFTKAYVADNLIAEPEKKRRSTILSEVAMRVSLEVNRGYLGFRGEALIEGRKKGGFFARLRLNYKPVVVFEEVKVGEIVEVKIEKAEAYHLVGRIVR